MIATKMRDMVSARGDSLLASEPSTTSRSLNLSTPLPSTTTVTTTSTPKIDIIYPPSSIRSTYTRPLNFWDNQTSFYNIFGLSPGMLLVIYRSSRVIEESNTLHSRSQLHIFCNIVQLRYVGTENHDFN